MATTRGIPAKKGRLLATLVALAGALALTLAALVAAGGPAEAAFPGQNGKIAFVRGSKSPPVSPAGEIFVMNADGSGQTRLTNNSAFDGLPSFSPNGERIAFTSRRTGGVDEIWAMNPEDADGDGREDGLVQITGNPPDAPHNFQSAYSPDGERIVFVSARDGNNEIYVMNADGSGQTRLTDNAAVDSRPVFSPDGEKIVFSRRDPRSLDTSLQRDDVWVMNSDGTMQDRLTTDPATDTHANFSPDGTKIVFSSERGGNTDLYVMNADGTEQDRLTTDPKVDEFPAFSPEGDEIVFSSDREGNFEIYVMKAALEGSENYPSRLTYDPAIDSKPEWGPFYDFDGFYAPVDGPPTVNVVKAGSAVPVKFSLGGDQGLEIFAAGYPKSQRIDCESGVPTDVIEETATAGESGLSYDATTGEYTYVWKTNKAWSGTCRQVAVKLDDTTVHRAYFEFK